MVFEDAAGLLACGVFFADPRLTGSTDPEIPGVPNDTEWLFAWKVWVEIL